MNKRAVGFITFFCILAMTAAFIAGCGCEKKVPEIKSIVPNSGEGGVEVVITGENFGATQEANNGVVEFAGLTAKIKSWSDTSVTCIVPAAVDPLEYKVTIKTDAGKSKPTNFVVTEAEKKEEPKVEEPKVEEPKTEVQVIEVYMQENKISDEGVDGKLPITFYKTSTIDPTWNLYQMPMGQGLDVTYFLVHQTDGKWEVVATWMGQGNAEEYGGPSDLKTPGQTG